MTVEVNLFYELEYDTVRTASGLQLPPLERWPRRGGEVRAVLPFILGGGWRDVVRACG